MKKQLLLFILLLFTLLANAQTEVININGTLVNPVGIGVKDNNLFIGQIGSQTLSRVDLSQPDPKPLTDISTNISFVADMILDGNLLYISTGDDNGSIYSMDVTDSSNTLTQIVSNLGGSPFGLAIQNDDLYTSIRLDNKIVKLDLSQATPTASDFVTNVPGSTLTDIEIYQGFLYFTTSSTNDSEDTISRVDLSQASPSVEVVVSNIPGPTGLALYQNILLIAAPSNNLVGMINLNDTNPTFQNVATLENPWNLTVQNNTLYIAQQGPNTISTMNISSLSNSNDDILNSVTIYPNPTSDYVRISNLSKPIDYRVMDLTGKTIISSTLQVNDPIDISSLSKGMYVLYLEGSSSSYKIIKE